MFNDWRVSLIALFSLVWIAYIYISTFGFIRVGMKREKIVATVEELKLKEKLEKCQEGK